MKAETIYEDMLAEVKALEETEESKKRQIFMEDYNQLTETIREKHAAIDAASAQGEFDEAASILSSIAQLEAKEKIMHPIYESYLSTPVYEPETLMGISKEVALTVNEELEKLEAEQQVLLSQVVEIQRKKVYYSKEAGRCRDKLMRLAKASDLREKLKFARVPEVEMWNLRRTLMDAGLLDMNR